MTQITTKKANSLHFPMHTGAPTPVAMELNILAADTTIASGDDIVVVDLPPDVYILDGYMQLPTLGTGCTATLYVGDTAVTAASTAAQANFLRFNTRWQGPTTTSSKLRVVIGGAAIGAAAVIRILVWFSPHTPVQCGAAS